MLSKQGRMYIEHDESFTIDGTVLIEYTGTESCVVVPEGITEIGEGAFCGNRDITEVYLPFSLIVIGEAAFSECENLQKLDMLEGVEIIKKHAFECCDHLRNVTLPASVNCIEPLFCGSDVHFSPLQPNKRYKVKSKCLIDTYTNTLLHCWDDSSFINIPEGVEHLAAWAIAVTTNENKVVHLPDGLKTIKYVGSGVNELCIPASVTDISEGALNAVNSISLAANGSVYRCRDGIIYNAQNNKLLTVATRDKYCYSIPRFIETIERGAFSHCANLKAISIPYRVTDIGYDVFFKCDNLKYICFDREEPLSHWDSWFMQRLRPNKKCEILWGDQWHYEPVPNK